MPGSSRRAFLQRSLALGVAAPSLAGLLAACTGDDAGPGGRAVPVRPAGATRKFSGTIVVATMQNPSLQARKALERAYQRHQPGVKLVWETKDTSAAAYTAWLRGQLTGSRIRPDIVSGNNAPMYHGFVNFDEYRAQVNPYTGRAWEDDYDFGLYRELNVRGERTVIGTEGTHPLWYYNKDVFSQAGVEPPTSWDALVAACAKLLAAGHVPIATNFGDVMTQWVPSIYFDQYHDTWVPSVRTQPGDWNWNPELDDKFEYNAKDPRLHASYTYSPQRFYRGVADKKLRFDTPAVVEVIANLRKVFPKYSTSDFFTSTDQYKPFLLGDTAMMVDGSGAMTLLHQDLEEVTAARQKKLALDKPVRKFDWDVFEFPSMRGPLVQSDVRPPEGASGDYLCVVDKDPGRTEMVMDFLMFWISKPGFSAFVQGQAEARELAPEGPALVTGVEYPKDVQDLVDKVKQKGIVGPAYGSFWVNGAGGKSGAGLQGLFISALQGTIDTLDYATKVQKYVQTNFAQLLRQASLTPADIANPARRPSVI